MAGGSEKVTFPSPSGAGLAARLDRPAGEPRAFALFAHCFTCSKDIFAASRISQALAERGFAVLRFDFTGLGASEGEFANTNFSSNLGDLVARLIICANSTSAAAADRPFARRRCRARGRAARAGGGGRRDHRRPVRSRPRHSPARRGAGRDRGQGRGRGGPRRPHLPVRKQFLDDLNEQRSASASPALRKALLIFHAPRDEIVGIENAGEIFTAARHPKSFVSLDDADHLLTRRADAIYVAEVLAAWASRYLPARREAMPRAAASADGVVVAETGEGRFSQVVRVGRHGCARTSRRASAATITGLVPTTTCSPGSAPAPR